MAEINTDPILEFPGHVDSTGRVKVAVPKFITCIVTRNRRELTEITINSYLNTTKLKNFLVVVDNGSDKETLDYLKSENRIDLLICNEENLFPGKACNLGWEEGLKQFPEADLLVRSDNDIFFRGGWDIYSMCLFEFFPQLGGLGLLDLYDRFFFGTNQPVIMEKLGYRMNTQVHDIGGAYIIRRKLWDDGLRHTELPWTEDYDTWEDHNISYAIRDMRNEEKKRYITGHVIEAVAVHLGIGYGFDPKHKDFFYYLENSERRAQAEYVQMLTDKLLQGDGDS